MSKCLILFWHIHTLLCKFVSIGSVLSHLIERKHWIAFILCNCFSARASSQPDVPTDECWKTLGMTQLLVWILFPLCFFWHSSSIMFRPNKQHCSRVTDCLTNSDLGIIPQLVVLDQCFPETKLIWSLYSEDCSCFVTDHCKVWY